MEMIFISEVTWKDFVHNNVGTAALTANGPLGPQVCVDYLPSNKTNGSKKPTSSGNAK